MSPRTTKQNLTLREERKSAIIEVALNLFAEEGYYTTSISKISKKAGISKGLIYNYFDSKEDLLLEITHSIANEFLSILPDVKNDLTDEIMEEYVVKSLDGVKLNLVHSKLYFSLSTQPSVTPILMKAMKNILNDLLASFLEYFTKKGYESPMEILRVFSAYIDGCQMHIILDPDNYPIEASKELIITQFIRNKKPVK